MKHDYQSRTKDELMVEVWERLENPPVGRSLLQKVQRVLADEFGAGAVESPAAIARTLVDAGADLSHPEVLEYDASWRATEHEADGDEPRVLFDLESGWTLRTAADWIQSLETLRAQLESKNDRHAVRQITALARTEKRQAQALAASTAFSSNQRAAALEIAEWLTIWLQTPELFPTWLDLRRHSPEFLEKFGNDEPKSTQ